MSSKSKHVMTLEKACSLRLHKQFLIEPAKKPIDVIQAIIAIQSQYPMSVPVAIWARCENLDPDWTSNAFSKTRELVKIWCMRHTIHAILSDDLSMFTHSIGFECLKKYEIALKERKGPDRDVIKKRNSRIMQALSNGPLYRSELHAKVPELANIPGASWGMDVKRLIFRGDVVINELSGRETRFARRDLWLSHKKWAPISNEKALENLLKRYLESYGPATMRDFAHWSGLKMAVVHSVFESIKKDSIDVEIAGLPDNNYLLKSDENFPDVKNIKPSGIKILPKFDAIMMSYKVKNGFLDEVDYKKVFRPAGQIEALVLLDGKVIATWRSEKQGSTLKFTVLPFTKIKAKETNEMKEPFRKLSEFLGSRIAKIEIVN